MNKLILGLALLVLMGMMTNVASAIDLEEMCEGAPTVVVGKVYSGNDINSPPVPDVMVDVTCMGNVESDVTNDIGRYMVVFDGGECALYENVSACVGDICGYGIVETCLEPNQLLILGVDIFNVPEFGIVAASVALAGAVAGFVFLRRKH
ncbi:MAG: hypothetical protein ABIJ21_09525 [Nanoarchaeota archaeon]